MVNFANLFASLPSNRACFCLARLYTWQTYSLYEMFQELDLIHALKFVSLQSLHVLQDKKTSLIWLRISWKNLWPNFSLEIFSKFCKTLYVCKCTEFTDFMYNVIKNYASCLTTNHIPYRPGWSKTVTMLSLSSSPNGIGLTSGVNLLQKAPHLEMDFAFRVQTAKWCRSGYPGRRMTDLPEQFTSSCSSMQEDWFS